jgi:hypothetical protein
MRWHTGRRVMKNQKPPKAIHLCEVRDQKIIRSITTSTRRDSEVDHSKIDEARGKAS